MGIAAKVAMFMPAGCRVCIELRGSPGQAVLMVEDPVPGIDAHERLAVLNPLHCGQSSRTTPGSGSGFSLLPEIMHGFSVVTDENRPGCRIKLPCQARRVRP